MQGVEHLELTQCEAGTILPVKAVPGSKNERIAGVLGDRLKVAVSAAPEKGKANKAIAAVIARALGTSAKNVRLRSRPTSPFKEFVVADMSVDQLRKRLGEL